MIEYILQCICLHLDPMTHFPENNTVVDTYRIIKEIGRGGMARIFEAEHTVTHKRCALKILAPVMKLIYCLNGFYKNLKHSLD